MYLNSGTVLLAYTDPGSGMLIWQLATAAVLGLLFYARTAIRKIRNLRSSSEPENDKGGAPQETEK
jgi:hypothetical protein